jgi:branched-chain amino acid transport system permease protein
VNLLVQVLNGLSLGSVYFLLAAGLSLTFGVLGILNLAHGALFAVGAYIGWTVAVYSGADFVFAMLAGGLVSMAIGVAMERLALRRLRDRLNDQVLVTLGLSLIIGNLILWIWGAVPRSPFVPPYLSGSVELMGTTYPVWRLAIVLIALSLALGLWALDRHTLIGARVRAGRDDAEMLEALGVNFDRLAMVVFALGAFIAGLGGVVGAQLLGANLSLVSSSLLLAVVVVVVGGLGSVSGSFAAAMILGVADTLGRALFPDLAMFTLFVVMVLILVLRPIGIGGREVERV